MSDLRLVLPDEVLETLADLIADRLTETLRSTSNTTGRWLTTAEAAEHLGITTNALYKLTSARQIPFEQRTRNGKCYFDPDELDRWRRRSAQG